LRKHSVSSPSAAMVLSPPMWLLTGNEPQDAARGAHRQAAGRVAPLSSRQAGRESALCGGVCISACLLVRCELTLRVSRSVRICRAVPTSR
jgi:hypothetical protein